MRERPGVEYGTAQGRPLQLDIYEPDEAASLRTAVLMFHGGGWRRGDRSSLASHARSLRAQGFTAIPAQYRLLDAAPWPAAVDDVKTAIRWVRANAADLAIEADRIVLAGFSAGAHLSLVAAGTPDLREFNGPRDDTRSSGVAAIAAFYPPTAFHAGSARQRGTSAADALLGDTYTDEDVRRASPVTYVGPDFPPTFLIHGGADRVVPTSSSFVMYDALREAGVSVDLHIVAGQNHAFDHVEPFGRVAMEEVGMFFRRTVSEREELERLALEQNPIARAQAQREQEQRNGAVE